MRIPDARRAGRIAVSAMALCAAVPSIGSAAEVTLHFNDGSLSVSGEFLRFQDNVYTVSTELGDLNIAGSRVTCEGAICPAIETKDAQFTVSGARELGEALVPLLIEGYAGTLGAEATLTSTNRTDESFAVLKGDVGYGPRIGSYLIRSSDTSDGLNRLTEKAAEIAMTGRRIRPNEATVLARSGSGSMIAPEQEHIVAVDGLMVIVHPDNPVETITYQQLRAIYLGEIANWSALGGADLPIRPITLRSDDAMRDVFVDVVMGEGAPPMTDAIETADDMIAAADRVNEAPGAVGFVGYSFQRGAKAATLVNACGQAEAPDAFSARTEEYSLQRRVYLYSRDDTATDDLRGFLAYATSPEADPFVTKAGFIGLGIDRRDQAGDGQRRDALGAITDRYEGGFAQDMLGRLADFDRLSTTFRFRTASSTLEERGQLDVERLVSYLEENAPNSEVLFVGFTDSVGPFQGNLALSEDRAAKVMERIAAAAGDRLPGVTMSSTGYGELAATGCNLTDGGRRINRRVEVWIKSAA